MTLPPLTVPANVPKEIKTICFFCGASTGNDPIFIKHAQEVAAALSGRYDAVYGGGSVGMMGSIAKTFLDHNRDVRAVVPKPLFLHGSQQIANVINVVPDMHSRKKTMYKHSDAFIVFPGGYGTLEEMMEMITWNQLNVHSKPIVLVNTKGYFNPFLKWVDVMIEESFLRAGNKDIFVVCNTPEDVLKALDTYVAPTTRIGLDWDA
ncbi:hypothetical protein DM01DRAFT_1410476 [Hesseltinella vesiculosa]|uniref:Cytokinin riboside 5'-monophosphate phosphoribohydrolase n=1 Tax=Hesseltinella vesiculosa TaxID=101127 RepID=A0A1X2G725_9FUNG|nr:hypothetical protein DM01DRAFT_1410476 [Hesseltinella vesiculosa]